MAAVAAQSVWDTGLRMPASAVLFAMVAAAAFHEPEPGQQLSVRAIIDRKSAIASTRSR
jgi:hypothetical protein